MTLTLPDSVTQYESYINQTPEAITQTYHCRDGLAEASTALQAANRIFFTGSGSSVPAALLGSQLLARYSTKAGIFSPSSLMLDKVQLTEADVVVLISQGWNRADAVLITRKVLQSNAHLIVITGHPERAIEREDTTKTVTVLPIFPVTEKIFCRPASAVTGYIKVVQLLEELTGITYSQDEWIEAYAKGIAMSAGDIGADKQYVVLTSSLLLCAGNNFALSLREGAGRYGLVQEIESYGHGVYVPDQAHNDGTHYFVLLNETDDYSKNAIGRIMPMLQDTHSNYEVWSVDEDSILGNVTLMGRIAKTILESISHDGWDMNNPPGMEENRSFHEVEL